jgi:hypothetical protein
MCTPNMTSYSSIEPIHEATSIKLASYATERRSLVMTTETREIVESNTVYNKRVKGREHIYLPHNKRHSHNYEIYFEADKI